MKIENHTRQLFKDLRARSPERIAQFIKKAFTSPKNLQLAFLPTTSETESSGCDLPVLLQIESLLLANAGTSLHECLMQGVTCLLKGQVLSIRAVFLLLAFEWIYQVENIDFLTEMVSAFGPELREAERQLALWLRELPEAALRTRIEHCQNLLSLEIMKISSQLGQLQEDSGYHHDDSLKAVQLTMDILWLSNSMQPRVHYSEFYNTEINKVVPPDQELFEFLEQPEHCEGNFLRHPYLLDLQFKQQLIETESRIEMMRSIKEAIVHPMLEHNKEMFFLLLEVNRESMLEEALERFSCGVDLKKPLKVVFRGEPGDDLGGPRKEFFMLMTRRLLDLGFGMFVLRNDAQFLWFNAHTWEAPIMFELVGILLGLAIYSSNLLELHFPPFFYDRLLKGDEGYQGVQLLQDLKVLDPVVHSSLQKVLDYPGDVSDLSLFFEAREQVLGQIFSTPLIQNGENTLVSNLNREDYVSIYAEYLLKKSVERQFNSFRRGFYKAVSPRMIQLCIGAELQTLLCGKSELDLKSLEEGSVYEQFERTTPIVQWLWDILEASPLQFRKQFLSFVTGSDRAPVTGLKSLQMVVKRNGPDSDNLPTAHTCFNVLLLPDYCSRAKLQDRLAKALEHNVGFGLI